MTILVCLVKAFDLNLYSFFKDRINNKPVFKSPRRKTSSYNLPLSQPLWKWDAKSLAQGIRTKQISCKEVTFSILERLHDINPKLNAVTVVDETGALKAAEEADLAIKRGEKLGLLHGIPVTIKESADQAGFATTNGVVAYKDNIALIDSPQVAAWRRTGAIIIGRTNCPAFTLRWDTDNYLRGRTYNPWNRNITPGGSSGGASSATAAGIAPLANSGDLGGSTRYPAYCCGLVGIRPTIGRVAAFNYTAKDERPFGAQWMSVQGPIARTVADARLGLLSMLSHDFHDVNYIPVPFFKAPKIKGPIKVALLAKPSGARVHSSVENAVRLAGKTLSDAGFIVEEPKSYPDLNALRECRSAILWTEIRHITSPLWRQLGGPDLNKVLDNVFSVIPDAGFEGYAKALKLRTKLAREWLLFLESYPIVLLPVSYEPPFEIGFDTGSVNRMAEVLQAQEPLGIAPFVGLPALSMPIDSFNNMPLGVQIMSQKFREDLCFMAAEVIEAKYPCSTPIDPR